MKFVRLIQIFCPVKETNRMHSKGYVEDSRAQCRQKMGDHQSARKTSGYTSRGTFSSKVPAAYDPSS